MPASKRRALGLTRTLSSLLLSIAACASTALADGRHALWEVKGERNSVYLFGSVHLLPDGEQLPVEVLDAYRDADVLMMEIDMDDLDPVAAQGVTLSLGVLPEGETLHDILGPAASKKFDQFAVELGMNPGMLVKFRPWLAALTLTQFHMMKMGLNPLAGVEQQFVARASSDKKEILGLETLSDQLKVLASLPQSQQVAFLLYTIDDAKNSQRELDELLDAWRRGDMTHLASLLEKGFKEFPQLYKPLTADRNRRWVPRIEQLLREDKNYLVIVGALHLVGDEGVIELLKSKDYVVKQR